MLLVDSTFIKLLSLFFNSLNASTSNGIIDCFTLGACLNLPSDISLNSSSIIEPVTPEPSVLPNNPLIALMILSNILLIKEVDSISFLLFM